MIRGVVFFFAVWGIVYGLIGMFRMLSRAEKWSVVKTLSYSALMAAIALIVITLMVVVF